jgi:DOPA 4,5-dioxygenase
MESMNTLSPDLISSWHAHVYFDASTRDAAWALRERIQTALDGLFDMGRSHTLNLAALAA